MTWIRCRSRSARSCRRRTLTNWRSSGASWRRRWRLSSILQHHRWSSWWCQSCSPSLGCWMTRWTNWRRWTLTTNREDSWRRVIANLAHYEQMLYKRRRRKLSMQSTLDSWFKKKPSYLEASATDEPHTSAEPYTSDEPQPGTSTGGYTCPTISSPSSSDVNDPDVI